jgi:hypothetical protein
MAIVLIAKSILILEGSTSVGDREIFLIIGKSYIESVINTH